MHELSLAIRVVEQVAALAAGARVLSVRLRIGTLAGVHEPTLRGAFAIAADGSPLERAALEVVVVRPHAWCAACDREAEIEWPGRPACPRCGGPTAGLRGGNDLEIESITVDEPSPEPEPAR